MTSLVLAKASWEFANGVLCKSSVSTFGSVHHWQISQCMCVLKENDPAESKIGHIIARRLHLQNSYLCQILQKSKKSSVSDWGPNTPTTYTEKTTIFIETPTKVFKILLT